MKRSIAGQKRRVANLKARINSLANNHFPKCMIIGCGQRTQRAARTGLSIGLCRKHQLHRQRHGSPFCRSPSANTLNPYLRAATELIELRGDDPYISAALAGIRDLIETAGPVIIAPRLRGLPPDHRAKVALARLRERGVKPERLLAIALAVHALIEDAPAATHRILEWRIVAIAKAAHRLASGYHRVWKLKDTNGHVVQRTELHAYPRSSGRVLRYLGEAIEKQCEWVIDHHLAQTVALKLAHGSAQAGAR